MIKDESRIKIENKDREIQNANNYVVELESRLEEINSKNEDLQSKLKGSLDAFVDLNKRYTHLQNISREKKNLSKKK